MIRVRFAPSPTGYLHIGGARTALFNWMYAQSQNGKFILRIEDTDRERSKQEYVDEILESMTWLGFKRDELYYQSERFGIYKEYAEKLVGEGKAYREETAVILKMSANPNLYGVGETSPQVIQWDDLIRGEIRFDTETIKDQVLLKSDGSPTYSFACVVDDALMEISHVIRGEDHISNTPKQIMIYRALGFKIPKFAHLPLIMGEEGGRLSKRTGATAVSDYRKMGFLPEAVVNYLMLLGWSPGGNQEIVSLPEAVKRFSIKKINKTAAEFSLDKFEWVNSQHLKKADPALLAGLLVPFLEAKGHNLRNFDRKKLESIVKLYQGRMNTLADFLDWTDFLFEDTLVIDEETRKKFFSGDTKKRFGLLSERLKASAVFDAPSAEAVFREVVKELGIEASELVHPVRVALTGKTVGPGLFDTMIILGKDKVIERLLKTG